MMKRLFFTAMMVFVLVMNVAKAQDTINVHEVYAEAEFCLDSITFFVTPEEGMNGTFPPHWITYDMEWNVIDTIEGLFYTVRETPTRFEYFNGLWQGAIWCDVTLHKTPEELKVSFECEVPLEPCGTEIFAYDLIDGEENPRLTCLWDDGETSYSRIVYDDGTYTVTVSDSCGRQVSNVWLVGDYTETYESVASSPSIYPNPSNGVFTIEGEGVYSIYNTVGQLVKTVNVKGRQEIVLPAGLYFVRNDETTTKVVVE